MQTYMYMCIHCSCNYCITSNCLLPLCKMRGCSHSISLQLFDFMRSMMLYVTVTVIVYQPMQKQLIRHEQQFWLTDKLLITINTKTCNYTKFTSEFDSMPYFEFYLKCFLSYCRLQYNRILCSIRLLYGRGADLSE